MATIKDHVLALRKGSDLLPSQGESALIPPHAPSHENGGHDLVKPENLATDELDSVLVLQPDGSGGVRWGAGLAGSYFSETQQYTDLANKVVGPFANAPSNKDIVNLAVGEGIMQIPIQDFTVREAVGGPNPGYYICVATDSSPPSGSWNGGVNPATGIDDILELNDKCTFWYAT